MLLATAYPQFLQTAVGEATTQEQTMGQRTSKGYATEQSNHITRTGIYQCGWSSCTRSCDRSCWGSSCTLLSHTCIGCIENCAEALWCCKCLVDKVVDTASQAIRCYRGFVDDLGRVISA